MNINYKFLMMFSIIIVVMSAISVYAEVLPKIKVDKPKPTITIIYSEAVDLNSVNALLENSSGGKFNVGISGYNPRRTIINLTSTDVLLEGEYTLTVKASDLYNNKITIRLLVLVEVSDLEIFIIRPSFGVSANTTFDLEIHTSRDAECRYASFDGSFDNFNKFNVTNSETHIKYGYVYKNENELYVKCYDSYKGEIVGNMFVLGVDITPAIINNIYARPNPIVQAPLTTTIFVETDEDTLCVLYDKADEEYVDFESEFFLTKHNVTITVPPLSGEMQKRSYNYSIECVNKADLLSMKNIVIFVDLSSGLSITKVNTPLYHTSQNVILDVETNKNADCFYGEDEDSINSRYQNTGHLSHTTTIVLFNEGIYKYYTRCHSAQEQQTVGIDIILDYSEPEILYVDDSNPDMPHNPDYTFSSTKLFGSWFAEDEQSGIKEYVYYVIDSETEKTIKEGTTTSTELWITNLNLNDSNTYYITVYAINNVGLRSGNESSDGITVNASMCSSEVDLNCDDCVSFQELVIYANKWIQDLVEYNNLIEAAKEWVIRDKDIC